MLAIIAGLVLVCIGAIQAHVQVLVVGGTGNLATKYLWPAFEHLRRRDASDQAAPSLRYWAGGVADVASGESALNDIPSASTLGVRYTRLRDDNDYKALSVNLDWDVDGMTGLVVYLAVPPHFFEAICHYVHAHLRRPTSWIRIVVEKPFGHDLASAQALATSLRGIFSDDELFLMDHYMGKRGVHGLRTFLAANQAEYAKMWLQLSHIQITMHEAETVATRTSFFDNVGIVRDVMANHLTLLWGLLNPPQDSTAHRRLDLVHQFAFDQNGVTLGQYDGYVQDVRIELSKPSSTTATAAAVSFRHKHRRGVVVSMAAGKGLSQRQVRVALHFGSTCVLVFVIQGPEGESIQVCEALLAAIVPPVGWIHANKTEMSISHGRLIPHVSMEALNAYTFLLGKVLDGDSSHFMHLDDVVEAWRLWQPILDHTDAAADGDLWTYPLGDGSFLDLHGKDQAGHEEL